MTEEQYILEQIALLQREYQKAIEPLVKRLAAIRATQPVRFFVTAEQYNELKQRMQDDWK